MDKKIAEWQHDVVTTIEKIISAFTNIVDIKNERIEQLQKENTELKAQIEEMQKYKIHSRYISSLPDCNTCVIQAKCSVRPKLGTVVRINCHLWRGTKEVKDGN